MNDRPTRRLIPVPDEETVAKDRKMIAVLSVLLIVSGLSVAAQVCYIYWDYSLEMFGNVWGAVGYILFGNTDNIIFILLGLLFFLRRKTIAVNRVAGGTAIALGIHLLNIAGTDPGLSLLDYYIQITSNMLSVGLLVFGVLLCLGRNKYARALGYISMFYVGYEILTYRYNIISFISGDDIMLYLLPFLPYTAMLLVFTALLFRRTVMPETMIKRMTESGTRIIDTGYTDPDTYMIRSDLQEMSELFKAPAENDDGIIDIERRYRLVSPLHSRMMTVRRLPGEDFLRVTVGSEDGSFTGYRFSVMQMVPDTGSMDDCRRVTMYGDSGMLVFITVRDSELSYRQLSALEMEEDRERLAE